MTPEAISVVDSYRRRRIPVLDSEMTNRVVYAEAALWGATPSLLDKKGPAAREIAAIADEVEHICESMAQVKRAANA